MRKIKITDANSNDKLKQWLNKSQQRIIINEKNEKLSQWYD